MDGLTISNSDALLERGQTLKEIRNSKIAIPNPSAEANGVGEKSFADTLKAAVQSTNQLQKESDAKIQQLATGKTDNVADVMITAEKADISLKLMTSVRNKIIEAYQEIMKMQV
ncbi:MAG: flagellar hook-basal body complex protein FliE [Bdellovibrionaceae bacterium]|nr:flagellar hook-basal body complex protein FliE [Pseudobdellovibrionaceae bacterium]